MVKKYSSPVEIKAAFLLFFLSFFSLTSLAKESENKIMNDLRLGDYSHFDRDWKMVTVRYRRDTNELRFVYANDKALKALRKGAGKYPDGAIFAKIGAAGTEDPHFKSSIVPEGAIRYQLMVKDKKKYSETGGWGYALFDSNGEVFPGDIKTQTLACYACHRIVPERGEVFSKEMKISPFATKEIFFAQGFTQIQSAHLEFKTYNVKDLPEKARILVPVEFKKIQLIEGDLRTYIFDGTLQEIIPTLMDQWRKTKNPAALFSKDFSRYSLLFGLKTKNVCKLTHQVGTDATIVVTVQEGEHRQRQDIHTVCVSDE